jgi:hypothetical protein
MRLALLIVASCSIGAAGACVAQEATLPDESSFITKLADEAIIADGDEAISNREQSRSVFFNAFLGGYSTPQGVIPVNASLYSSRMNGKGWSAGQAYRRAHPDSVAQIMHEYGYIEFEGVGAWTFGFEAGGFQPDDARDALRANSPQACWYLAFIHSADLDAQLGRIFPPNTFLHGGTLRVRVKGYVSSLGEFGHLGMCQRRLYAVSVSAGDD